MSAERIKQRFAEALGISEDKVVDDLKYNTIPEWDSIAHMAMVAAIEKEFNIMLEIEDIIAMSDFSKVKSLLSKYGVDSK